MIHDIKIREEYLDAILAGTKNFEIRKNDRNYQIGDTVVLNEIDESGASYTGRKVTVVITYVTDYEQKEGYVVFGFDRIELV